MLRIAVPIVVVVAVAIVALTASQRRTDELIVSGFAEAEDIRVGSRVAGRVSAVHVEEGTHVAQGALLIEFEPHDLHQRLAEARATLAARQAVLNQRRAGFRSEDIAQARARRDHAVAVLEKLQAGPRPLEIKILEDRLARTAALLARAKTEHARVARLFEASQASPEEMDIAERSLETAHAEHAVAEDELALAREGTRAEEIAEGRAQLAEVQAALALVESGYRPEDVAEAEALVAAAEANIAAIQQQVAELEVRAPVDGVIEAINLARGDLVAAGAPVLTLIDESKLWVRAYVPERRLSIAVGQRVAVRFDALPDRTIPGRIVYVAAQAEFTPANVQTPEERVKQVFRIKVVLDEGHGDVRPGMAGDVLLESAE